MPTPDLLGLYPPRIVWVCADPLITITRSPLWVRAQLYTSVVANPESTAMRSIPVWPPSVVGYVFLRSPDSRSHGAGVYISPSNTTCSTDQLSKPGPHATTSHSRRSFWTSTPAVSTYPPAGTVPIW